MPGTTRCYRHGSRGGRPAGYPEHANSKAARIEGRRRWVERMNAARARGEIERFRNGRRRADLPKLSKDRRIRKAHRIIEARMEEREKKAAAVPAVAERSFEELDKATQLSEATTESLVKVYRFLCKDTDLTEDPKMFALQQQVALSTISAQIRLDAAVLMARSGPVLNEDERQRLDQAHRRWAMLEAEEAEKMEAQDDGDDLAAAQ